MTTDTSSSTEITDRTVINELRLVQGQCDSAWHSWTLFSASVRNFEANQSDLVDSVNSADLRTTVNHLQTILLHDCVSAVYRMLEGKKPDCVNLNSAVRMVRQKYAQTCLDQVREIDRKRKSIVTSASAEELIVFRKHELGHLLRTRAPQTAYAPIPLLIEKIWDVLNDCFQLLGYPSWIGQTTAQGNSRRAKAFWDCVEIGANYIASK